MLTRVRNGLTITRAHVIEVQGNWHDNDSTAADVKQRGLASIQSAAGRARLEDVKSEVISLVKDLDISLRALSVAHRFSRAQLERFRGDVHHE